MNIESKIRLNQTVVNIRRNPQSKYSKVDLYFADGSKISVDHVIFTGSLGVLKKNHKTLFTPQLPKRKIRAIQTMGYGTLGKIFLEFSKPFWPTNVDEWVGYSFLWSRFDKEKLKGSDKEWYENFFVISFDFHINFPG